jgi:hypothetical protein
MLKWIGKKNKMCGDIDPKYLGIPNINFSLTNKEDYREEKFKKQRIEMGFDDSEGWSFDITIANFILPRLKYFKNTFGEETERKCDKIILALELIVRNGGDRIWTIQETKEINKGLKLLSKYFLQLWN